MILAYILVNTAHISVGYTPRELLVHKSLTASFIIPEAGFLAVKLMAQKM